MATRIVMTPTTIQVSGTESYFDAASESYKTRTIIREITIMVRTEIEIPDDLDNAAAQAAADFMAEQIAEQIWANMSDAEQQAVLDASNPAERTELLSARVDRFDIRQGMLAIDPAAVEALPAPVQDAVWEIVSPAHGTTAFEPGESPISIGGIEIVDEALIVGDEVPATIATTRDIMEGTDRVARFLDDGDASGLLDFMATNEVPFELIVEDMNRRYGTDWSVDDGAAEIAELVSSISFAPGNAQQESGAAMTSALSDWLTGDDPAAGAEFLTYYMVHELYFAPGGDAGDIVEAVVNRIDELGSPLVFDTAADTFYGIMGDDFDELYEGVEGYVSYGEDPLGWLGFVLADYLAYGAAPGSSEAYRAELVYGTITGEMPASIPNLTASGGNRLENMQDVFDGYVAYLEATGYPYDPTGLTAGQSSYDFLVWLATGNDVDQWLLEAGIRTEEDYAENPGLRVEDRFLFGLYVTSNNRGEGTGLMSTSFFSPAGGLVGTARTMARSGLHFILRADSTGMAPGISDTQFAYGAGTEGPVTQTPNQTINALGHGLTGAHMGWLWPNLTDRGAWEVESCAAGHERPFADPGIWDSMLQQIPVIAGQCLSGADMLDNVYDVDGDGQGDTNAFMYAVAIATYGGPGGTEGVYDTSPLDASDLWLIDANSRFLLPDLAALGDHSMIEGREGNSVEDMNLTIVMFAFGVMVEANAFSSPEEAAAWLDSAIGPNAEWPAPEDQWNPDTDRSPPGGTGTLGVAA